MATEHSETPNAGGGEGRLEPQLGFLALWREDWSEEPLLRTAELAARAKARLSLHCVVDVGGAQDDATRGGAGAADPRDARRLQGRAVDACRRIHEVEATEATVSGAEAVVEELSTRVDTIVLSSPDFHELCQWYRAKTPFHVVQEQRTPVLVVDPATETLATNVLVVDTGSTVADPVGEIGREVRGLASSLVQVSDRLDPGEAWSWRRIERSAAEAECDTLVVHPPEGVSLPLIGKHARLRHVLTETHLSVLLV